MSLCDRQYQTVTYLSQEPRRKEKVMGQKNYVTKENQNFPNVAENILQIQETQPFSSRINTNTHIPKNIRFKLLKTTNKEISSTAAREK